MTITPINDDGDTGSMHNAVLKGKYKKLNLASTNPVIWKTIYHLLSQHVPVTTLHMSHIQAILSNVHTTNNNYYTFKTAQ